ncbi:hypothetical protein TMPK1_21510 [Rhodospirillales bacterium TMPK1]|uniref:Peptidase S9 prolyl oligopeptidase catalytic domain-containing protein n=2 Tax=Roseiterribacter gracilis TaxID=2812848 RepID=A0A8S8XAY7_9PROT|nr:hypothetical protein TMPK1_21510 [Rhodospirillales bacterium TMPK1]
MLSARDLVEVSELANLRLSPDGSVVVVDEIRPDVASNSIKRTWRLISVAQGKLLSSVPAGEARIEVNYTIHYEAPVWSADSKWFYYLALREGAVQVWRTSSTGMRTEQVTRDEADVENFTLDPGSHLLFYNVRATRAAIAAAERREFERGVAIDGSIVLTGPVFGGYPINGGNHSARLFGRSLTGILGGEPLRTKAIDLRVLRLVEVTPQDKDRYTKLVTPIDVGEVEVADVVKSSDGRYVAYRRASPRTAEQKLQSVPAMYSIVVKEIGRSNSEVVCSVESCPGSVKHLRWSDQGAVLYFVTEESQGTIATLHAWDAATKATSAVYSSGGLITSNVPYYSSTCPIAKGEAFCIVASAKIPPAVVAVNLKDKSSRALYAPSSSIQSRIPFSAEHISWKDVTGKTTTGVLVLPDQTTPSAGFPLVIVTYRCRGFLRGGTGDEYPEFLFARAGIAALCVNFDLQTVVGSDGEGGAVIDAGRRAGLATYEAAIELLSSKKLIDRSKVGIVGLSYGAGLAQYALMHSNLFAAASISQGGISDPIRWYFAPPGGIFRRYMEENVHLPPPYNDPKGIWAQKSPALNASKISAPILIQASDQEFIYGLEFFSNLADAKKPVEMVVFKDEGHVKTQPVHKLAVYDRNVAWFRFWLQGIEEADPRDPQQLERWKKLAATAVELGRQEQTSN